VLRPKNPKEFYSDIAKEVDVHKDVVHDFVAFFYAKFRKNLSELKAPKINLTGLGTFSIRKNKLEKAIKRNKDILGNLEKMTYSGYEKYLPVKSKLKEMEEALKMVNENITKKKKFKDENK
jgi:nucleoid DNA-binding protein